MYLPRNKYKTEQITDSSVISSNGQIYNGPVIKTSSGKIFKGSNLDNIEEELFPIGSVENILQLEIPYNVYITPTENDYERGFYTRYFLRQSSNHNYKEVDRNQYFKFLNQDGIISGRVRWYLQGPATNQTINGFFFEGTEEKNKKSLLEIQKNFPYILEVIDTSQFIK